MPFERIDVRERAQREHERYGLFNCPVSYALEILRRKWAFQIITHLNLSDKPIRFNQLERDLEPITQKELTKRLRELEKARIVERYVYAEVPLRVEYVLARGGRDLMPALFALSDWGKKYGLDEE